ncbi:hypothetical protein F5Y09DRAFT_320556 [Xylaria sp. FL1042]|nr:hypothetical protein F5Y09DRAFT_320556 [Xylaria sp. FL1042]
MCLSLAICHITIRLVDSLSWTLTLASLPPRGNPKARVGAAGVFQIVPSSFPSHPPVRQIRASQNGFTNLLSMSCPCRRN